MDEIDIWALTIIITVVGLIAFNAYIQKEDEEKSSAIESLKNIGEDISESVKKDKSNIFTVLFVSIVPLGIIGGTVLAVKAILDKLVS